MDTVIVLKQKAQQLQVVIALFFELGRHKHAHFACKNDEKGLTHLAVSAQTSTLVEVLELQNFVNSVQKISVVLLPESFKERDLPREIGMHKFILLSRPLISVFCQDILDFL